MFVRIIIVALCLLVCSWGIANTARAVTLETDAGLREKVYLHFDKAFYMPGEIAWFKAYVVDAKTHKPSEVSHVAYVEVVSQTRNRLIQAKIPLGAGESNSGSLFIPHDLPSGRYQVIAYTALMENHGPNSFFDAYIDIINPLLETVAPAIDGGNPSRVLHFFPESGRLLDGVETNMGFKLVDGSGKGQAFHAVVYEQDTLQVARIAGNRFGIGSFRFTPKKGSRYTVRLQTGSGYERINVDFPEVEDDGYLFNVERTGSSGFRVRVVGTRRQANERLKLVAAGNQRLDRAWDVRLDWEAKAEQYLAMDDLPVGLVCLTLLDADGRPVAERVVFRHGVPKIEINSDFSNRAAKNRGHLDIAIRIPPQQIADSPDLSVAVFRVDSLQQVPNGHIGAYLHLQSEVKGYIEDIDYYFSSQEEGVIKDLDALLLTQAWRKIKLVSDTQNIVEYKSHHVAIRFFDSATGQPIRNEMAFLSVPAEHSATYTATTDDQGIAMFSVRNLYGSKQIIAQLATRSNAGYEAEMLSPYAASYPGMVAPAFPLDGSQADILSRSVEIQAEHLFHRKERGRYYPIDETSLPFYGRGDVTYWLDDYTRFVLMEEVLREYVTEVSVRRNRQDYRFRVFNKDNNGYSSGEPLLLLDGIPLPNANGIIEYDPLKIEKIDIVTARYYYGNGIFDGIVSFSTYDGRIDGFELDEEVKVFNYEGLQYEREFYVPQYDGGVDDGQRLPDFRNVLLWQPRLVFDEHGESLLNITTSDLSGRFAVVIQGIDEQGRAAYHVDYFDVN